jgi:cell wall assembly regulator SMI1
MFDQAVLSGANVSSTVPLLPLDRTSYWKFYRDYKEKDRLTLGATKQVVTSVLADLGNRMPADILWLFVHSPGFDGNLDTETALIRATEQQLDRYIFLTKQLLNRRLESKQIEQHYSSILDLKDTLDLDKYRIDRIKYR